jgi:hypothetical protein
MSQNPLPKQDKIVENVLEKYRQRSQLGIKKYNTTLEENDKDDYLLHLQQELMDASLYIEKLMSKSCTKSSQTEINGSKGSDETFAKGSEKQYLSQINTSQTEHNSPKVENKTSFGEISPQTEISDEEIEKRVKEVGAMGEYYKMGYRDAIKWYREQLKQIK